MKTWASVYSISDFPWKLKMPTPSSLLHYIWFVVRLLLNANVASS